MTVLVLPWPPKELSPNSRVHWAVKHRHGKAQKMNAFHLSRHLRKHFVGAEAVSVELTFYPPSRRRHDLDNLISRMKWALDGVAAGIDVDDSKFRLEHGIVTEVDPEGAHVIAILTPLAKQEAA